MKKDIMTTPRRNLIAIIIILGLINGMLLVPKFEPIPGFAQNIDPRTAPIPELDFGAQSKAVVVNLNFINRTDAELVSGLVSLGTPSTNIANPPLLRVQVFDYRGQLVDEFNSWHPLWAFTYEDGRESLRILPNATGEIIFPFQPELAAMTVSDIALDQEVVSVDLKPIIQDYCRENIIDFYCWEVDLAVLNITSSDFSPVILTNESADVTISTTIVSNDIDVPPVDAIVENVVESPDTGIIITPLDVTISATAAITNIENFINPGEQRRVDSNYNIACIQPGRYDVSVISNITAASGAMVDINPNNNRGNSSLTVNCMMD